MFCKRCGNENPEDAVYCIKCGYNMWDKSKQKPPVPNPSTESVSAHVSVPRHEHTQTGIGSCSVAGTARVSAQADRCFYLDWRCIIELFSPMGNM